jgi:hypothetical protein
VGLGHQPLRPAGLWRLSACPRPPEDPRAASRPTVPSKAPSPHPPALHAAHTRHTRDTTHDKTHDAHTRCEQLNNRKGGENRGRVTHAAAGLTHSIAVVGTCSSPARSGEVMTMTMMCMHPPEASC